MILKIDHLGIAVTNLDEAARIYETLLQKKPSGVEEVSDQKVKTVFFDVGESHFELLEATSPDSPVAKFIEKNGGRGGLHHVAVAVENIEAILKELAANGVKLIDKEPRIGANNKKIAFIHPKSTGGVLLELCEGMKKQGQG